MSDNSTSTASAPRRTLGAPKIAFLLIAAMTPLSVLVGTIPLGLGLGGPSTSWAFVIVGIIVALFVVGYTQMVKQMDRPGAFYSYITRGLGRPAGVGAAIAASVGYAVGYVGSFAISGFILNGALLGLGIDLPWQLLMLVMAGIVAVLTWFQIDFNSIILGIIIVGEIIMSAWFIIAVIVKDGANALPANVWSGDVFQIGSWTVAFIFAMLCFQGFESGALYAPEAKHPGRSVPRALYSSLIILVVLYAFGAWVLVGAAGGIDNVMQAVFDGQFAGFFFATAGEAMGPVGLSLLSIVTILAQLAILIGITSFMSRYIASVAKERILPRGLSRTNRFGAPSVAIFILLLLGVVLTLGFAAAGIDPYAVLSSAAFGLGAIISSGLWAVTSLAVFVYFRKASPSERNWWKTTTAPVLSFITLIGMVVIMLMGFEVIAGGLPWAWILPPIALLLFIVGIVYALIMRSRRPEVYAKLGTGNTAEEASEIFG